MAAHSRHSCVSVINRFFFATYVDCSHNNLDNLDNLHLPYLTHLICNNNDIQNLDSVDLPRLTNLTCHDNNILTISDSITKNLRSLQVSKQCTYDKSKMLENCWIVKT